MLSQRVQLVRDAQSDRPGSVSDLVDAWLPVVLRWCTRLGGHSVNAEDAAQDVLETVLDRLPTLREPEAFPAWLYGITRRTLAQHRRRAWLKRWVPGLAPDAPDPGPGPLQVSEMSQTARRVWDALDALPLHHKEILVLCDMEERADSEVAEMLGIPKNTVKSRLRRAREALRGHLGDLRMPDDEGGS